MQPDAYHDGGKEGEGRGWEGMGGEGRGGVESG